MNVCVCVCIKFGHCACTMLIGVFNKFKDSSSGSTLVEKLQEKIKELVSGIEYESIRVWIWDYAWVRNIGSRVERVHW